MCVKNVYFIQLYIAYAILLKKIGNSGTSRVVFQTSKFEQGL